MSRIFNSTHALHCLLNGGFPAKRGFGRHANAFTEARQQMFGPFCPRSPERRSLALGEAKEAKGIGLCAIRDRDYGRLGSRGSHIEKPLMQSDTQIDGIPTRPCT